MKNKRAPIRTNNNFFTKNRKASHIGTIVSFAIFITFLFFLYAILQPSLTSERNKQYILDYVKMNLMENVTGNFTTMTINISEQIPKPCVKIQSIVADIPNPEDLIFKNNEAETLLYSLSGRGFRVEVGEGFSGILKIYYSDDLNSSLGETSTDCTPITQVEPDFIKSYNKIFESRIQELNESYYDNYEGLKIEIGVPEGTEFSFYVYDSERNLLISAEYEIPPETESIYSEEIPVQYMDEGGNIKFGFLIIKVW